MARSLHCRPDPNEDTLADRNRRLPLSSLALCSLAATAAHAQITPGQGLTSDETARRAVATSPDIAGGRADVEASRAAVSSAKTGYIPKVQGTARYTRLSDVGPQVLGNFVVAGAGTPVGP